MLPAATAWDPQGRLMPPAAGCEFATEGCRPGQADLKAVLADYLEQEISMEIDDKEETN